MVELLVNATLALGKQELAGVLKFGLGCGFTNSGKVRIVLLQPLLVVTNSVTL